MSFARACIFRASAMSALAMPTLALAACAPDTSFTRPDALPELDAASYADAGGLDAPIDAVVASDDAPLPMDAATEADAFTSADAFVATDTNERDAAVVRDAATSADAGPVWTVGFCRVQFPASIMGSPGTSTVVYARVYAAGLTTRSGMTDTDALLVAEVGHGPDGSHPSMPSWTWARGGTNAGYGPGSAGYEANNDEYQATLVAPGAGTYDFAYRVSGDGGLTWTYCDTLDPGSSDGYQLANAGALVVL